jgi:predicted dehydrogenase
MGVPDGEVIGAEIFANGDGGVGTVRLLGGQAVWHMAHIVVPSLADYRERIALYFDDRIVELTFPSPYLNHQPTRLVERRSDGQHLNEIHHRPSYAEPFVEEMKAWHAAITAGASVVNTVEQAARDIALLTDFARLAAANRREAPRFT